MGGFRLERCCDRRDGMQGAWKEEGKMEHSVGSGKLALRGKVE